MVSIKGLNKAEVLKALYDGSHVQGYGFLQSAPEGGVTVKHCEELLKKYHYFDYLYGRVIKVDLSGDEFDERLYDRDLGDGAAEKAIASLTKDAKKSELPEGKDLKKKIIDPNRIEEIFRDCLFKETPKVGTEFIPGHGVTVFFAFDPDKVGKYEEEIITMLDQLNDKFREESGGGYSLIEAPFTKDGVQWGEQFDADHLMLLGMATGHVRYLLEDRFMWRMLPGGVPYYVIVNDKFEPERQVVTEKMLGGRK